MIPRYYAVKPREWEDGEEYTCFAFDADEAVEKFLSDNDYDASRDGVIFLVELEV